MGKKKEKGINPAVEDAIEELLTIVMNDPQTSITDKVKVLDRALKLEALKAKMSDAEWGSGFFADDDDEEK